MEIASLAVIKKELKALPAEEVLALCLRLTQAKKENKELLNYLLFEAQDEEHYIQKNIDEMEQGFEEMNQNSFYLAKKTIRKLLRTVKKNIKFSGKRETEIALLIHFCRKLQNIPFKINEHKLLFNLYHRQIEAIHKALDKLHEDLQYDYREQIAALNKQGSISKFY